MKKIIAAAVTVTTVLSLAACGGNTAVDKSDCLDVPQDVLNVVASGSDSSDLVTINQHIAEAIRKGRRSAL